MPGYIMHSGFMLFCLFVLGAIEHKSTGWTPSSIDDLIFIGIIIIIGLYYSLLPDVDHPISKARKITFAMSLIGIIILLGHTLYIMSSKLETSILLKSITDNIIIALILAVAMLLILSLKHRGPAHTILAGLGFSVLLLNFSVIYFTMGFVGYLSHLFLDGELKLWGAIKHKIY